LRMIDVRANARRSEWVRVMRLFFGVAATRSERLVQYGKKRSPRVAATRD